MNFFKQLFGRTSDGSDNEPPSMPWDQHPSILEFVRSHILIGKPGLSDDGYDLPDEDRIAEGSKIRWAAGARDGVATHHMGTGDNQKAARKMVKLIVAYSRRPTVKNKAAIYQHIISEQVVSLIDPVLEALPQEKGISHERLYELARSFATESPDREPVKFGIAILGLFRQPADEEIFQTLGRHDEFTLYCAVAIVNALEDHQDSLWELARNATGWGRIHVVERLAQVATSPAIKDWLLREGFRSSVMNEYLAATCARAGGLLAALSDDPLDQEMLTAAGEILQAMIAGGPADSIDEYEDARPVIEHYLRHMAASAQTIPQFLHVHAIKGYLDDDSLWASRYDAGWTAECRNRLRTQCDAILARPEWPARVRAELTSQDEVRFFDADQAAKPLGIDTWAIHWQRLQDKPAVPARWYHVMALCNDDRIGMVVELAQASLDLAAVSTGAADELGLGAGFEQHGCLDYILQELRRFPGQGALLIETGLKSPVIRNRNFAVAALEAWPRDRWPAGLSESLQRAARCEPEQSVREGMDKVLRGEPRHP